MIKLKPATHSEFMDALQEGDIGVSQGRSIFARLQNLFRKRRSGPEVDMHASHGFYFKVPPSISEADGKLITGKNIVDRYLDGRHRVWVFRHHAVQDRHLKKMRAYVRGAEETGGIYAWKSIWQFAKRFFTGKEMKDKPGVFCTEYTSRIIETGGLLPYLEVDAHKIDPSTQLSWLMKNSIVWPLVAYFDRGDYYLPEKDKDGDK